MHIEIDQNAMSVHIRIMGDKEDWRSEVAFVYKCWDIKRNGGPLFNEKVIHPARARMFTFSHDGQGPVMSFLQANIYNAISAHLVYQLDEMFKTLEDFKRKIKVDQIGPVFWVEWTEEEANET